MAEDSSSELIEEIERELILEFEKLNLWKEKMLKKIRKLKKPAEPGESSKEPGSCLEPPTVVHLKRKNGKEVVSCDVYIGRAIHMGGWSFPKSKWSNPFNLKDYDNDREAVIKLYREYILSRKDLLDSLPELAGKRLGCWCAPEACHGDVLVELFKLKVLKEAR